LLWGSCSLRVFLYVEIFLIGLQYKLVSMLDSSPLFRYYARIPSTGSSSLSSLTPAGLCGPSIASSSQSVAPYSSQSQGMSICNASRKQKTDPAKVLQARR
jgi:hypothetical protein